MMGFDAPYVPGWDCHGLPIEHRIDKELGPKKAGMSPREVRALCRAHAEKYIAVQKGRVPPARGDVGPGAQTPPRRAPARRPAGRSTARSIARTKRRSSGSSAIFFAKGSVYYGEKPVHWCFSCKNRPGRSRGRIRGPHRPVGVREVRSAAVSRPEFPRSTGKNTQVVIWTTTPWTLPANLAVALHPDLPYVAVEVGGDALHRRRRASLQGVGASGLERPQASSRRSREASSSAKAATWIGDRARSSGRTPSVTGRPQAPACSSSEPTSRWTPERGASIRRPGTAPTISASGTQYGLPPFNPVADDGTYVPAKVAPEWLKGVHVLKANDLIVKDLAARGWLPPPRSVPAQLPALLALPQPGALPRDAAVVHLDGRRRASRARRSPRSIKAPGSRRSASSASRR